MIKVGLTGGIGSGKSTVSSFFKKEGIPIIDADKISREVLLKYSDILEKIKEKFGEEFFDEKGELKRRELGNYVFKEEERRKSLENIIIPYIKKEIYNKIEAYESDGQKFCIIDAPTLIEHKLDKEMDKNILVWVDLETQIERVKKRDGLEKEEVINRINSQMSLDEKKKYVDVIIDNSKSIEYTKKQINNLLKAFRLRG